MAEHEITTAEDGTGVQTLTAATIDTVTIAPGRKEPKGRGSRDQVRVISDGVADVYVTFDGTDPAADGTSGERMPIGAVSVLEENIPAGEGGEVKLISDGTPTYSVSVR